VQAVALAPQVAQLASQSAHDAPAWYFPAGHAPTQTPEEIRNPSAQVVHAAAPVQLVQFAAHAVQVPPSAYVPAGQDATHAPCDR
jgi:hypothetical protein